MLKVGAKLKFAQQSQTSMKCKVSAKIMNDKDPPIWIPLKKAELTDRQKEEAKKNANLSAELKMQSGYLICKSAFDSLPEVQVEQPENGFLEQEKVRCFRCPLTGDLVEKSKTRRVYFC